MGITNVLLASKAQIGELKGGRLTAGTGGSNMKAVTSSLGQWVEVFKALGHPVRLRMVALLAEKELCVCQLAAVVGLAFSTVSTHLSALRRAGVVAERKEGRWVYYALALHKPQIERLLQDLLPDLAVHPQVRQDRALLQCLRRLPLSEVTRRATTRGRLPVAGKGNL